MDFKVQAIERLQQHHHDRHRQGQAAKEFLIQKIVQNQKFWFPMVTIIQKPGGTRQTLFEISRGDRDVEVPLSDFSLDEIKKTAAAN